MLKLALEKVEKMLIEYFRISRLEHLHHGIRLYVIVRRLSEAQNPNAKIQIGCPHMSISFELK